MQWPQAGKSIDYNRHAQACSCSLASCLALASTLVSNDTIQSAITTHQPSVLNLGQKTATEHEK